MLSPSDVVACLAPSEWALLATMLVLAFDVVWPRDARSRPRSDAALALIAIVAVPHGAALFVIDWNHAMHAVGAIDAASKAAFLAACLRDTSVHLGLGLAVTVLALVLRSLLGAGTRPVDRRTTASASYWSVAGVVSALLLVVQFLFVTANFAPLGALKVDVGACPPDAPSVRIRANGRVDRVVDGGVVASAKVRDLAWLVSAAERGANLWADDGVSNAQVVAVIDAFRGTRVRDLCFPADEHERPRRVPDSP